MATEFIDKREKPPRPDRDGKTWADQALKNARVASQQRVVQLAVRSGWRYCFCVSEIITLWRIRINSKTRAPYSRDYCGHPINGVFIFHAVYFEYRSKPDGGRMALQEHLCKPLRVHTRRGVASCSVFFLTTERTLHNCLTVGCDSED